MNHSPTSSLSRRQVTRGIAWASPAIAAVAAAPAFAASPKPVLSSILWFSGRGTTSDHTSTCAVPEHTSATAACTPDENYPWSARFQFYGTDDPITSDAGTCVRDSSISITNLRADQITGPITLTFWRPEHPDLDVNWDIRRWYRGANDSGRWTVPTRTATAPVAPFGGTWTGVRMYEYQTTLSLAAARAYFISDGTGGVTLAMTKSTAALSFFSDCVPFNYTRTETYLRDYGRLGRYVLSVPTTAGTLVKDTGFYIS